MSEMSFLEKLLDGVEVEWKALKDIGSYVRGLVYNKSSESSDGQGYKVLRANNITLSENSLNFDDVKIVNFDTKVKKYQKLRCNDILISAASGSREHVGKVAFIETDIDYYFGGFMGVIRCNASMIPRYAFHVLTSQHFKIYLDEMLNSSTINNLNSAVMGNFKFPIPCPDNPKKSIEIQAEIVRILDAMTAHTAELTAELTARKKQYDYYRDKLLSFEEGEVEWKQLGEEFPFIRNGFVGTVTPFFTTRDKGVRYLQGTNINNGNIRDNVEYYVNLAFHEKHSRTQLKADDILLVQSGHVGDSAVVGEKYKGSNCHALIVISNGGRMNSKFVNYYFQSKQGKEQLRKITTGGTVKHILASKMKKFFIPVPPLEIQNRIVALLDKFNVLTTSITNGLPREIELRQKQYAYYRDLLLSFPAAQAA